MTAITIDSLTKATLDGDGVFDVLMRANKAHLEAEFNKNRIKGPEYSQVYLGSLTQVLQTAVQFLLAKDKMDLERQLLEQQVLLAQAEVAKANAMVLQVQAQTDLVKQQTENALAELAIIQANADKVPAEIRHLDAQTGLIGQQKTNLTAEALNIPKQGQLIDAQKDVQTAQKGHLDSDTSLINQKRLNAVTENTVLVAQECKLRAEYDLTMETKTKVSQETALLTQKTVTERAQVAAIGVEDNSVIGRQKLLYNAQTNGFTRDAEQKAADLMIKSWMTRRTTDEGTVADGTNMLYDSAVGRAVNKLLSGVGA